MTKYVRKKQVIMLFVAAAVLSVAGCGGKSETAQADEKTREQDAKNGMMKA
jgi:ABC-type phosphate transport system substrate-binding protein